MHIDPIWRPENQQHLFRQLMEAMSHPGQIVDLSPWLETGASDLGVLATLLDAEVSFSDHHNILPEHYWPMLQARKSDTAQADYILCDGGKPPDFTPKLGSLSCPDQSATLVVRVRGFTQDGLQLKLSGPGIQQETSVAVDGLHEAWLQHRVRWIEAFPMGVDCIFVDRTSIMALPRTTRVESS